MIQKTMLFARGGDGFRLELLQLDDEVFHWFRIDVLDRVHVGVAQRLSPACM
jgi:hypothetical protein